MLAEKFYRVPRTIFIYSQDLVQVVDNICLKLASELPGNKKKQLLQLYY